MSAGKCILCGRRAHQRHHIVYQQELRRAAPVPRWDKRDGRTRPDEVVEAAARQAELLRDNRNLVPVCHPCHGRHHSGACQFSLGLLPDSVFVFAAEVLGEGPAYEYLRRRYSGDDRRLDALVSKEAA